MTDSHEFDLPTIRRLLAELGRRLAAEGILGDIRLVGGAAVMFAGSHRRTTADIDASYIPKSDVDRVAATMAKDMTLPAGWLNDNARAFIPDGARWTEIDVGEGLKASIATDETLLAMKVAAERDRDIPDIGYLARKLGLDRPEEVVDVAFGQYGELSIPLSGNRADYIIVVEEALAATAGEDDWRD